MKICAIGDPHGNLDKIKQIPLSKVDLILLTGDLGSADLTRSMTYESINHTKKYNPSEIQKAFNETEVSTLKLVNYLSKYAQVYIVYGNVELTPHIPGRTKTFASEIFLTEKLNSIKNIKIINNKIVNCNGIKIGGLEYFVDTNWVQEFKPSDKKNMAKAKEQTDKAKRVLKWFNYLDILVCHQPPYGILDKVSSKYAPKQWQGKHAGSKIILDYIQRKQPKYVFCGHIHEEKGMQKIGKTKIYNLGLAGYKIIELS